MKVQLSHINIQGIDCAVFDTDARTRSDSDRAKLLNELTTIARQAGFRIYKSALAYVNSGHIEFYGTPDLTRYLANQGVLCWTHTINI